MKLRHFKIEFYKDEKLTDCYYTDYQDGSSSNEALIKAQAERIKAGEIYQNYFISEISFEQYWGAKP